MLNRIYTNVNNVTKNTMALVSDTSTAIKANPNYVYYCTIGGAISGFCYGINLIINSANELNELQLNNANLTGNIATTYNCTVNAGELSCEDPSNQNLVNEIFNRAQKDNINSEEFAVLKVVGLGMLAPICCIFVGGVCGFYSSVTFVNAKLAISQDIANPVTALCKREEQEKLNKIVAITRLEPKQAKAFLVKGMRAWLLNGSELINTGKEPVPGKIPVKVFNLITAAMADLDVQDIDAIRGCAFNQLYIQTKASNLEKYKQALFSSDPIKNKQLFDAEEVRVEQKSKERNKLSLINTAKNEETTEEEISVVKLLVPTSGLKLFNKIRKKRDVSVKDLEEGTAIHRQNEESMGTIERNDRDFSSKKYF